jgi:hypothetical protein
MTESPTPELPDNTAAPDWDQIEAEYRCPLCEYNLRGLIEPRCPECGYTFQWCELETNRVRLHPWLFEHHPKRNIRSWLRTTAMAWLPRRFWKQLQPTHLISIRRLVIFYLVSLIMLVAAYIGMLTPRAIAVAQSNAIDVQWFVQQHATSYEQSYNQPPSEPQLRAFERQFIQSAPVSPLRVLQNSLLLRPPDRPRKLSALCALGCAAAWPWLTLLSLQAFRISMRQARIRKVHMLRLAIYGTNCALWIASGSMLLAGVLSFQQNPNFLNPRSHDMMVAAVVLGTWLISVYHLGMAARHYLRFSFAFAVAFSSQIIVMLIALIIILRPLS